MTSESTAAELVELIGPEPAQLLCQALGGGRWYVPENWPDDHPVVVAVGRDYANKISDRFRGVDLEIPKGEADKRQRRNAEIHRRFDHGESTRSIALALHLSQRMVRYVLANSADTSEG